MALHDLTDFLRLSAALNMQLTAQGVGRENIVRLITNRVPLERDSERKALLHVLEYLDHAYGAQRRASVPVLHRATTLLARRRAGPTARHAHRLLHDKYEDLTVGPGPERLASRPSSEPAEGHRSHRRMVPHKRLDHLAIRAGESYGKHRPAAHRPQTPSCGSACRPARQHLDMHINVDDFAQGHRLFPGEFQVLFPPSGIRYRRHNTRSIPRSTGTAFYQLSERIPSPYPGRRRSGRPDLHALRRSPGGMVR